jgi:hypothetical protein
MSKSLSDVEKHAAQEELLALNAKIHVLEEKLRRAEKRRDALKRGDA